MLRPIPLPAPVTSAVFKVEAKAVSSRCKRRSARIPPDRRVGRDRHAGAHPRSFYGSGPTGARMRRPTTRASPARSRRASSPVRSKRTRPRRHEPAAAAIPRIGRMIATAGQPLIETPAQTFMLWSSRARPDTACDADPETRGVAGGVGSIAGVARSPACWPGRRGPGCRMPAGAVAEVEAGVGGAGGRRPAGVPVVVGASPASGRRRRRGRRRGGHDGRTTEAVLTVERGRDARRRGRARRGRGRDQGGGLGDIELAERDAGDRVIDRVGPALEPRLDLSRPWAACRTATRRSAGAGRPRR